VSILIFIGILFIWYKSPAQAVPRKTKTLIKSITVVAQEKVENEARGVVFTNLLADKVTVEILLADKKYNKVNFLGKSHIFTKAELSSHLATIRNFARSVEHEADEIFYDFPEKNKAIVRFKQTVVVEIPNGVSTIRDTMNTSYTFLKGKEGWKVTEIKMITINPPKTRKTN